MPPFFAAMPDAEADLSRLAGDREPLNTTQREPLGRGIMAIAREPRCRAGQWHAICYKLWYTSRGGRGPPPSRRCAGHGEQLELRFARTVMTARTDRRNGSHFLPAAVLLSAISVGRAYCESLTSATPSTEQGLVATGQSFFVQSFCGGPEPKEILAAADRIRETACRRWLAGDSKHAWRPRCEIVLHPGRESYLRSVGAAGQQTSGSSLIERRGDHITRRRIDLLVDATGRFSALPHELTHVVLADLFVGNTPPAWLDEGIATLADTEAKQARHQRDCRQALASGDALPLFKLFELDRLTSREQAAAFYGQSLSLVVFLSERRDPSRLLPFVRLAERVGYDEALRRDYSIDGVAQLQRLWRAGVVASLPTADLARSTPR